MESGGCAKFVTITLTPQMLLWTLSPRIARGKGPDDLPTERSTTTAFCRSTEYLSEVSKSLLSPECRLKPREIP